MPLAGEGARDDRFGRFFFAGFCWLDLRLAAFCPLVGSLGTLAGDGCFGDLAVRGELDDLARVMGDLLTVLGSLAVEVALFRGRPRLRFCAVADTVGADLTGDVIGVDLRDRVLGTDWSLACARVSRGVPFGVVIGAADEATATGG